MRPTLRRLTLVVFSLMLALLPLRAWAGADMPTAPAAAAVMPMPADGHAETHLAGHGEADGCADCATDVACAACHAAAAPGPALPKLTPSARARTWLHAPVSIALAGAWQAPFRPPRA